MKPSRILIIITAIIAVLASIAAGAGVFWQGSGAHYAFQSLRAGEIMIQGTGIYKYDSMSAASQATAADAVTLCVGIPLLLLGLVLYAKGSLKGHLLLTGTLGYFLYTYAMIAFMSAYNPLFLVYVALFSLSLFGTAMAISSIPVRELSAHFSSSFPRKSVAGFLLFLGIVIFVMWMGRIVPTLPDASTPAGLDIYSTLVVQVMDLGIIFPLGILSGVLLLQRKPWGYALASVLLIKGLTMSISVTAMGFGEIMAGVNISIFEIAPFIVLTLLDITMTVLLFRSISETEVRYIPQPAT
jgi:hypothetical protein